MQIINRKDFYRKMNTVSFYLCCAIAVLGIVSSVAVAQKEVKKNDLYNAANSPKIDTAKPSVSITPSEPALTHYGDDYFILSMNNNYVWDIRVCSYDPIDTKTNTGGISYTLEVLPSNTVVHYSDGTTSEKPIEKPPYFIGTNSHFCRLITIPSGKSVFFPVPKAHAQQNGTDIKVNFLLPWEDFNKWEEMQETTHTAKFRLSTLRNK